MAVRALLHYALEVPDQTVGEKFYTSFGLIDEARRDGSVALRPAPLKRASVLLYGGPKKRLHHLVTAAAALANWHAHTLGKTNMRPGIAPPTGGGA